MERKIPDNVLDYMDHEDMPSGISQAERYQYASSLARAAQKRAKVKKPKIIQILRDVDNGVLLGLGDDGIVYSANQRKWYPYIEELGTDD